MRRPVVGATYRFAARRRDAMNVHAETVTMTTSRPPRTAASRMRTCASGVGVAAVVLSSASLPNRPLSSYNVDQSTTVCTNIS